jgi:hypothetical protein
MERRLHERTQVHFEARVTDLTTGGPSSLGRVSDLSNSGLSVSLPRQYATGDRIQMEMADSILTGRVVYSKADKSDFRIGIEIDKVELGSSSLAELLQRTLLESMPSLPGVETAETRLC